MVTSTFSLNYAHVFPGHLEGGQRIMFDNNNNNNNIVPLGKTLRKRFPLKKQFLKEVFPGAWPGQVLNNKYLPGLKNPEET